MHSRLNQHQEGAVLELRRDLLQAQSELRLANVTADRLRSRFTIEQVAQHGESDVLQTVHATVTNLHNYFSTVTLRVVDREQCERSADPELTEAEVLHALKEVSSYMRTQRDRYALMAEPLEPHEERMMTGFFSSRLLAHVRIVRLADRGMERLPAGPSQGHFRHLLELTHLPSVTFEDILVFNDKVTARSLFHALVHAVQFDLLGLDRYTDLFVRAFMASGWRFTIPLEAHAFELQSRFAAKPASIFPVEDEVRAWIARTF